MADLNYDGTKKYQAFIIDEWNNIWGTWFADTLEEIESELNDLLSQYILVDEEGYPTGEHPSFGEDGTLGPLREKPGTFGPVADSDLFEVRLIKNDVFTVDGCLQVRVFIYE